MIKKRIKKVESFFRVLGLLIVFGIIIIILNGFGIWSKLAIWDKIFVVAAGIILSFLFGIKRENILVPSPQIMAKLNKNKFLKR